MNTIQRSGELVSDPPEIFWGEIAPCEHLVQIYRDDRAFLDSLEEFVGGGLKSGDGVIVIATPAHLAALEDRLRHSGVSLSIARASDQFIPLDAEEALSEFMIGGWPDDALFHQFLTEILSRSRGDGRRVRAFGEMVAVLWGQGHNGATVRLEHLWNGVCQREELSLLCAYPRSGFTQDAEASIQEICAAHSRAIAC